MQTNASHKEPREIPAGDARRSLSERNKILELPRSIKESLPGPFAVVGLGISNLPLIDFLLAHGATVVARDRKSREELGDTAARLEAAGVTLRLGEQYLEVLDERVIFRSPGLRPDLPEFLGAIRHGAYVTSEMELFLELTPARVLGITGSDGKTTTTTLTALFLRAEQELRGSAVRVFVGGNIGEPLLPRAEDMTANDFAVVELSSFQLMDLRVSPERAAVTNLSPNHLNWHTDMEEYIEAKANIFRGSGNSLLVTNAENGDCLRLAAECKVPVTLFSSVKTDEEEFPLVASRAVYVRDGMICLSGKPILAVSDILLPGRHNLENYMTAIGLTAGLVSPEAVRRVATTFRGVAHRLERVAVKNGVTFINSSIDSSPTRTMAALSALEGKPIVICGGRDKHVPFDDLARALNDRAKAVVLTGEAAGLIGAALETVGATVPVYTEAEFDRAVRRAAELAAAGDTVLLSPACTSFDAFRNFEERGERFRRLVKEL